MALIEIKAEPGLLKELIQVLQRIAAGIDRAYPPRPDTAALKGTKPHGPDDIVIFDPEAEWLREEEEEVRNS
jgi:hypothetical protein